MIETVIATTLFFIQVIIWAGLDHSQAFSIYTLDKPGQV